jgi:hypothetical protein
VDVTVKKLKPLVAAVGVGLGLACLAAPAHAAVTVQAAGTDAGNNLVRYVIKLVSDGPGALPINALDLQFEGNLNQQGAPLNTTFNDNNTLIPIVAPGQSADRDSQWAYLSTTLTLVSGNRDTGRGRNGESTAYLSGVFGLGAANTIPVGSQGAQIAQIVLPADETAHLFGSVSQQGGTSVPIDVIIPVPEPGLLGAYGFTAVAWLWRRRRKMA